MAMPQLRVNGDGYGYQGVASRCKNGSETEIVECAVDAL